MSDDESENLDDFFRCERRDDHWAFEVAVVEWDSQMPRLAWKSFRHWPTAPDSKQLDEARSAALKTPRFFRTCTRCGELNNAGHMFDRRICQGCAERFLGVIF